MIYERYSKNTIFSAIFKTFHVHTIIRSPIQASTGKGVSHLYLLNKRLLLLNADKYASSMPDTSSAVSALRLHDLENLGTSDEWTLRLG